MKHVGEEIHRIIEAKHLVKKDVASQAHMTYANLANIKRKPSIDCQLLENLCKIIGVSPAYFFDDNQQNFQAKGININTDIDYANVNISHGEIEMLHQMLAEKERTIQILMQSRGFSAETNTRQNSKE